ncbi:MAG: hypothetical protein D6B25_08810 [Desulfobulbaceae bacterium]|nr:MAG: hypothetical protein D6B25_08810 [Desulfobulbaceae bacterium]
MDISKKDKIHTLLKGIETGDPAAASVVNENKYIQHNPLTPTGNIGLAELFKRLSQTSPQVDIVRIFEDGDFVFAHTNYDFNVLEIGFEVFRFEDGLAVEHWDNLQLKPEHPNQSGHTMIDGPTEATDHDQTEANRAFINTYVKEILIESELEKLNHFVDTDYTEHNPERADGLMSLLESFRNNSENKRYDTLHRVLAEGSFVLSIGEGSLDGVHTSFYDLFRLSSDRKIVEHWDTIDMIPPRTEWKNNNGKF